MKWTRKVITFVFVSDFKISLISIVFQKEFYLLYTYFLVSPLLIIMLLKGQARRDGYIKESDDEFLASEDDDEELIIRGYQFLHVFT